MRSWKIVATVVIALGVSLTALTSCSTTYPRRNPVGEAFPDVAGRALDGTSVRFPAVGAGAPMILLIGYDQDAQFDIDRWLYGLVDASVDARAYEVPTLPGLVPRMLRDTIDGGMRRGIPLEDWGGVVTLYEGADRVAAFTGNEDGLTGRVLVLDAKGRVVFFHDRGYSIGSLKRMQNCLKELGSK